MLERELAPLQAGAALFPAAALRSELGTLRLGQYRAALWQHAEGSGVTGRAAERAPLPQMGPATRPLSLDKLMLSTLNMDACGAQASCARCCALAPRWRAWDCWRGG